MKYFFLNIIMCILWGCSYNIKLDAKQNLSIEDKYEYLEDLDKPLVQKWYEEETKKSKNQLNNIEGRDSLIDKMMNLSNDQSGAIYKVKITDSLQYFYLKDNDEGIGNLYFKKDYNSQEVFLYSPMSYRADLKRNYSINYINPSWDNSKVAISLSYEGKELSDIIILDIHTGELLPDIITNASPKSFLGINWLPNNKGFTYLHFPDPNKKIGESVLHTLGEKAEDRKVILSKNTHPDIVPDNSSYPTTVIKQSSDKYIVAYLSGVDNYWDSYYLNIDSLTNPKINWKPFFKKEDKVYRNSGVFLNNNTYIFKSGKNFSNFEIAQLIVEKKEFTQPEILVESKENKIIDEFQVVGNGKIYYTTIKNGIEAEFYKYEEGVDKKIKLPKKSGEISITGISRINNYIYLSTSGWLNDYIDYYYDFDKDQFIKKNLIEEINYIDFKDLIVKEIEIESHDKVLVPLTIIYDKNIKMDGNNSSLITGYGAYGDSYTAYFSPILLSYVSEGGVLAIAHVRGGGEKGSIWHEGGQKTKKYNTWKDLIACTEYLIDEKFTSKTKTSILSSSAGGIMIGRAMIERPELFGAIISQSAILNPLMLDSSVGGSNIKEFGDIKDPIEYKALAQMDPYLNLKDKNVNYPPMLLTVGINDRRVPIWMSGKFAARLKDSDTKNPILLSVDYKSGHKGSELVNEYYKKWANVFSFSFWQTGHPDYQLKE